MWKPRFRGRAETFSRQFVHGGGKRAASRVREDCGNFFNIRIRSRILLMASARGSFTFRLVILHSSETFVVVE